MWRNNKPRSRDDEEDIEDEDREQLVCSMRGDRLGTIAIPNYSGFRFVGLNIAQRMVQTCKIMGDQ